MCAEESYFGVGARSLYAVLTSARRDLSSRGRAGYFDPGPKDSEIRNNARRISGGRLVRRDSGANPCPGLIQIGCIDIELS